MGFCYLSSYSSPRECAVTQCTPYTMPTHAAAVVTAQWLLGWAWQVCYTVCHPLWVGDHCHPCDCLSGVLGRIDWRQEFGAPVTSPPCFCPKGPVFIICEDTRHLSLGTDHLRLRSFHWGDRTKEGGRVRSYDGLACSLRRINCMWTSSQ